MEDSTRRKSISKDDKVKIVIGDASSSNNNSYVLPAVVTTDGNSEIVNEVATTAAVEEPKLSKPTPSIIPKVPPVMRNHKNNKGVFDPKVVSIGPYHHGKLVFRFVEKVKPEVARLFVLGNANHKNETEFYKEVLGKVDDFRSCYGEGSTDKYTREKFAKMMFLDGCFILAWIEDYYLEISRYDNVTTHLGMLVWRLAANDIFDLLENQLPFQVLELLMRLKFKDDEGMKRIHAYLNFLASGDIQHVRNKNKVEINEIEKSPLHLLHLLRIKFLNPPLDILESQRHRGTDKSRKRHWKELVYSFRSVTELKAKGIHFRPSTSLSLKAIKFKSYCFWGHLKLRQLIVSSQTKHFFSNMIAYEFCSNNRQDCVVSSYISFMKSFIDHPDDVKELRKKKILFNALGSDEEVVNVFKEITTFGIEDYRIYDKVKESIQDHYNSKTKTLMAEFIHIHFSKPWTGIGFFIATSLLVLAFLQAHHTLSSQLGHK